MTHYQQAVVTGFVLANDVNNRLRSTTSKPARSMFRYCPIIADAATRRLQADSLVADWFTYQGK